MVKQLRPALLILLTLTLLTGVAYPLLTMGIAQAMFRDKANGSLLAVEGAIIGSELIGQTNSDPRYFWGRPSAVGYDPLPSGGSNLAPTSAALRGQMNERANAFREAHNLPAEAPVPAEMLFASGSGLDPHISPDAARLQIDRVAAARGLDRFVVARLVEDHIEPPQLGFLGRARINVLLLNIALDQIQ